MINFRSNVNSQLCISALIAREAGAHFGSPRRQRRPTADRQAMHIDWITWSVFAVGLVMLIYWCVQTIAEFKALFQRRLNDRKGKHDG